MLVCLIFETEMTSEGAFAEKNAVIKGNYIMILSL